MASHLSTTLGLSQEATLHPWLGTGKMRNSSNGKTFILDPFGYVYGRMYTYININYVLYMYDIHFVQSRNKEHDSNI